MQFHRYKLSSFRNAVLFLLLAGCSSTPYQKMGHRGGYDDFRISERDFEITFRGNTRTREEVVDRYLLRRAAEVAVENGFCCFLVLKEQDRTRVSTRTIGDSSTSYFGYETATATAYGNRAYGTSDTSGHSFGSHSSVTKPLVAPAGSIRIRCFKNPNPDFDDLIDAQKFLDWNPIEKDAKNRKKSS